MKNLRLNRQLQRLHSLIERTPTATAADLQLQAHWGRYLCVLAAGFLENALAEIYSEYAYRTASPAVARYVSKVLLRVQNPKVSRFIEIAGNFNDEWARDLEEFVRQNGRKEAIDGIMNLRNQVAHGQDAQISIARVSDYLLRSVEVVDYIEVQCS